MMRDWGDFQARESLASLDRGVHALAANGLAKAASAGEINASVNATLDRFYRRIPGPELSARATGAGVSDRLRRDSGRRQYGGGATCVSAARQSDTTTRSGVVRLQLGAQARSVIIIFTRPSLAGFRRVEGFKVG
jgi:hypothetical protein